MQQIEQYVQARTTGSIHLYLHQTDFQEYLLVSRWCGCFFTSFRLPLDYGGSGCLCLFF